MASAAITLRVVFPGGKMDQTKSLFIIYCVALTFSAQAKAAEEQAAASAPATASNVDPKAATTFLVQAMMQKDEHQALELIKLGADPNGRDQSGIPVLNWSVMMCMPQVVKALVDHKASLTYLTSRAAGHDFRSFRNSATDDSGATTEGSSLPNLNYLSARLSVSPWAKHTFSVGALESIDSEAVRTVVGPNGDARTLPSTIWSARYGYRFTDHLSASAGQTYVTGRKFSDPTTGLNYRSNGFDEQGLGQRAGLSLSLPTTERSHNEQLITQATVRSSLSYMAGRWTSSGGLAYSRPFYMHPASLAVTSFGPPPTAPGAPPPHAHGHHGAPTPGGDGGPAAAAVNDPNVGTLEAVDLVMGERVADRSTGSVGVSFQPSYHWKLGTGAGLTYLETWKQKTIWLTSARVLTAAYSFWKMEAGSDFSLYSDIHKYAHPSLPSLMNVGLHLTYFMGAERQTQL